jgi:hypothetical protein
MSLSCFNRQVPKINPKLFIDQVISNKHLLAVQALGVNPKAAYPTIFENPCVGGSIPPRATKKHQNHLRVVFSFGNFKNLL